MKKRKKEENAKNHIDEEMKNKYTYFFIFFIVIGLAACDSDGVYDQFIPIEEGKWHRDSIYSFTFTIEDTLSIHHIFINNRISGQYPYSRMYMFVNTKFPDNKEIHDTLECILAKSSGQLLGERKLLGKGFGNLYYNKIPYKTNIRFPASGNYTITVEQGMRDAVLPEVFDIGVRVEKAK